jgi:replicative DNA helicase
MKKILRSVIDADGQVSQDSLLKNYIYLSQSSLSLADEEDREIWNYIQNYALNYSACPTTDTIRDFLERHGELSTVDRLDEIASFTRVYENSDFENLIEEEVKLQKDQEMHVVLKTSAQILFDGLTIKEGRETVTYKGHRGAMKYIMKNADDLLASDRGQRTKSNITYDSQEVREEFDRVCAARKKSWGVITGLRDIDQVCRGIKSGEMWTHAGFTGEFKTGFALNWAYRAVFLLQHNVYYLSLEMPVDQIRRIIYVMHSNHPKFQGQGWPRLSYRLIRDGEDVEGNPISEEQKEFYRHVIDDVEENRGKSYGSFIVRSPDEEVTVPRLRQDMEITHQQTPLHMCIVDHFALMRPEKSTRNYYTDLNSIVRDTKRLALSFNGGERIPILGLLQINRSGKLEAEKNDGVYKMQALADSNEAERSSDVITTSFLNNDLRANRSMKFGCLKNRDNPHFLPFTANVDWETRYLYNDFSTASDHRMLNANSQEDMQRIIEEDMMGQEATSEEGEE